MSNLEALLKAYVEITVLWSKAPVGENCTRLWRSAEFLQKLIKLEASK